MTQTPPAPPNIIAAAAELNDDHTAVNLLLQMADAAGQPTHVVALPLTADQAIMMGGHLLAKAGAVLAKPSSGITVARGLLPPNGTFSKAG